MTEPYAEAELLRLGIPLAELVTRRVARRLRGLVPIDDIRSICGVALLEAMRSYDPTRTAFAGYIRVKLKWAIFDQLRREARGRAVLARINAIMASERLGDELGDELFEPSEPATAEEWHERFTALLDGHAAALAVGLATSTCGALGTFAEVTPEEQTERAELTDQLQQALTKLPERERALIHRHYYGGEPFDAIARDLGISKSWASRLHERAISALAKALRGDEDDDGDEDE